MMNKQPLERHDVRQAAYRGTDNDTDESGVPSGKSRHDPSADLSQVPNTARQSASDDADDHSGRVQPNFGQAGTYGGTQSDPAGKAQSSASPDEEE